MSGNMKKTMLLNLKVDLDSKEAQQNIQKLSKEALAFTSQFNKSGNSMDVFKKLVSFVSQLDSEMSAFRNKHEDDFKRIFSGVDNALLQQMQGIFGNTKEQLAQINTLRDKITAARGKKDLSADELKGMEQEIRSLYKSIGQGGQAGLSGRGAFEKRLNNMEASLDKFIASWESVNDRISKGFATGLGAGAAGGSGLEGFTAEVQAEIDKIQNEVNELEALKKQYQKAVKDLNTAKATKDLVNEGKYTPETSIAGVQKLMAEHNELTQKIQSGNKESVEYYQNLSRLAEVSVKLSNSQKMITANKDLKQQFRNAPADNISAGDKYAELLNYTGTRTEAFIKKRVDGADNVANINKFISAKKQEIEVVKQAQNVHNQSVPKENKYDELSSKLKRYIALQKQLDDINTNSEEFSKLENDAMDLEDEIMQLSKLGDKADEVMMILNGMDFDNMDENAVLEKLCNTLGIEIPQSAEKAEQALKEMNNATSGSENVAIDKLESDLKQVRDLASQTQKELSFSVTAEGVKYVVESMRGVTKISDEAAAAVRTLEGRLSVLSHTHPGGNGYFSVADLRSGLNAKSMGVNSPIMAMSKNMASVLNLDGVTDAARKQVEARLSKMSSDDIISPKIFKELQGIFKTHGFGDALKTFDLTGGTNELANFLKEISVNAKEAQTPLEKLQSLISYYSNGKMNGNNLNQFNSYWDEFKQGAKSAAEVFDAVMAKLNARDLDGNLIQVGKQDYQSLEVASKNIAVGDNATDIKKEAAAHKDNADAIQKEADAKKQSASQDDKQSGNTANINKSITSYEELCRIVERYNQLITKSNRTKQDDEEISSITSRIAETKTGGDINKAVNHAMAFRGLVNPFDGTTGANALANYLGIEIPGAAEKAESALKELDSATEKTGANATDLNKVENALEDVETQAKQTANAMDRVGDSSISTPKGLDDQKVHTKHQVPDIDSSAEIQQLERLDAKVKEVITAVEAKTQAFKAEENMVSSVVQQEIGDLEKLINKLKEVENKIDALKSAFKSVDDATNNIDQKVQSTEKKVADNKDASSKGYSATGKDYALDSTLHTTNSILKSILSAVSGDGSANQVAQALDGAIAELKAAASALKANADDFKRKAKDNAKNDSTSSKKAQTFNEVQSGINKKILTGQINAINKEAANAMKGVKTTIDPAKDLDGYNKQRAKQEEIIQGYKDIQLASAMCTDQVKNNQNVEIDALNKKKQELLKNIQAYKQQYDLANFGGKSGQHYGSTAVMRETTRYNQFQKYAGDADMGFKNSGMFNSKLQEYTNAYNRLIAIREKLSSKPVLTDRDVQEFNDAKQAAANYGKELDKMIAKSQKLEANQFKSNAIGSDINVDNALSRKQALTDFVTSMHNARESTIRFSNDFQECTFKMKNSDGTYSKMTATLDKFSNKMYSTAGEITKYKTAFGEFGGALKKEFAKLGRYMIASFGIQEVIQVVRKGVTYVKQIDDALTDLKKVTNETDAGYERFLQTMSKTAGVVGSTVAELTTMAAEWARLGYNMAEAANLAESTAVLLNVSEFEDATQASEALISTIQAFDYAAEDSMHVVDILNEVGKFIARR